MDTATELEKWHEHIQSSRIPILKKVAERVKFHGRILEIGAGTAWLSLELSKFPEVAEILAIEINPQRINVSKNYFAHKLQGNIKKVHYLNGDFNNISSSLGLFDFIVCEAALHHTNSLPELLKALHSMLKPDGSLIAIREPILPSLPILRQYKKFSFGKAQIKEGDIENIYDKHEWINYFKFAKFNLEIVPVYTEASAKEIIISRLKPLNNILFNRNVFIAYKS
jgi:ubiquinone/menaquinone biosynthesis C-methylase UbiE